MKKINNPQQSTIVFTTPQKTLKLTLIVACCCSMIGMSFNAIPFIFLTPSYFCKSVISQISEQQFCKLKDFHSEDCMIQKLYKADSIVTDYNLYCSKKNYLVVIQAITLLGHILGCTLVIFMGSKLHPKQLIKWLALTNILIGIILICTISKSLIIITIVNFIWAMAIQFVNCSIYVTISYIFSYNYLTKFLPIFNLSFSIYSFFIPLLFYITGSWRGFILIWIAIPSFTVGAIIYKIKLNLNEQHSQDYKCLDQDKLLSFTQTLNSYKYQIISLIMISFYPFLTEFLILNQIKNSSFSSFTTKYFLGQCLEIVGGILTIYICRKFTDYNTILGYLLILSILSLCFKQFCTDQLKFLLLCFGKILSDTLWGIIPNYTLKILPRKCLLTFYGIKYVAILLSSFLLPFVVYLMKFWKSSIFIFLLILIVSGFYIVNALNNNIKADDKKETQLQLLNKQSLN